jgi:CcmD family protein
MDKFGYMLITFTLVWVTMVVYIFMLGQKQKRLGEEIDRLKAALPKSK